MAVFTYISIHTPLTHTPLSASDFLPANPTFQQRYISHYSLHYTTPNELHSLGYQITETKLLSLVVMMAKIGVREILRNQKSELGFRAMF
jgi:hypothetical protein